MKYTIFIRTWREDIQWLKYSVASIKKYAKDDYRLIICVPSEDYDLFYSDEFFRPYLIEWKERHKDGYVDQQINKLHAHWYTTDEYILMTDSDIIFFRNFTLQSFFKEDKPYFVYTPYTTLGDTTPWKAPTEKHLGISVENEFMRRLPMVFHRHTFEVLHAWLMKHRNLTPIEYLSGLPDRNVSEFNMLGALAFKTHADRYHWVNTDVNPMPPLIARQFWSWGGITKEVRTFLTEFLPETLGEESTVQNNTAFREGSDNLYEVTDFGVYVVKNDTHISQWVKETGTLKHDRYLFECILPSYIQPEFNVLDIGANIGVHTRYYLDSVGLTGSVTAVEANPIAYNCLIRNCPEARCLNAAMGELGKRYHVVSCDNLGAARLEEGKDGDIAALELTSRCFASIYEFIKLDIEGMEWTVLKNSKEFLQDCMLPVLFIEINQPLLVLNDGSYTKIVNFLRDTGYTTFVNVPATTDVNKDPQFDIIVTA